MLSCSVAVIVLYSIAVAVPRLAESTADTGSSAKSKGSARRIRSFRCGVPLVERTNARIVGGNDAIHGVWPWQVSVRSFRSGHSHFCGGVLVRRNWVVTAAHCVDRGRRPYVTMGESRLYNNDDTEVTIRAKTIFIHPDYEGGAYDIALLKLKKKVRYNRYMLPACLPKSSRVVPPGAICAISGWGTVAEGDAGLPNRLQEADVPIVRGSTCSAAYAFLVDANLEVCAGYMSGGVDSCQGDSGGPLVCQSATGAYMLHGVVSWGRGCARPGYPGVYTLVPAMVRWIKQTIRTNVNT